MQHSPACARIASALGTCAALLALLAAGGANAGAPAYYQKKATWHATMLASREALIRQRAKAATLPGFKPFVSRLARGRQQPQQIDVDISMLERLWLVADVGGDSYSWDQAIWGEPTLVAADGTKTPLTKLKPVSVKVGWGNLIVNNNHTKAGLRVGSRKFAHGFWAHAPSALCFQVGRKYARFQAAVGVDLAAGTHGSVRFHVVDRAGASGDLAALWGMLARDFPGPAARREMAWEREDSLWEQDWKPGDLAPLALRYAAAAGRVALLAQQAKRLAASAADPKALAAVRTLYLRSRRLHKATARIEGIDFEPLRRAVRDLIDTYPGRYPDGPAFLRQLDALEATAQKALAAADKTDLEAMEAVSRVTEDFETLRQKALLANPLLDFDRLLVVRRGSKNLALPANWQGNSSVARTGYDNEIAFLSPARPGGTLTTLHKPDGRKFVGDVDLHFDADRMLFSSIGTNGRWHVFEMKLDGSGLRQLTPADVSDVDHYDACYLPDGRIIFSSTAPFIGVPCVFGGSHVSMLYRMNADGSGIRQLCFEQDHDWCPTVLNNGRVLYLRWEYTDTPHSQTRLLFHMNPDGTEQMEYYGSNSYWPNSFFYARPIPGHPTKVVGIASGHHGVRRMGELVILDPALGRREHTGAVQRIPGYGQKVEMIIRDQLVNASWPKFLHPYPLSEKYFLVAAQPTSKSLWGIYLVDVFDNMLLLHEEQGYAMLEPVPVRPVPTPPVVVDKFKPGRTDAVVYMADVYKGDGLKGIPRGSVKKLRVFAYHFAYHGMGGLLGVVGMDGPWDPKRILGTVPVEPDGSALFSVPANTPIAIQPLDAQGKALQLMRSWMTAMPGEVLSCVGCHERQNTTPDNRPTQALTRTPRPIEPWHGPARCFSYPREVQPVIDRYCTRCHDGAQASDLRGTQKITGFKMVTPGNGGRRGGRFSVGYAELHRYVRRSGIESDYHLLTPMEFHADTAELVQLLKKGHYGVRLDPESWDRLITWIDLNAPYHGTWTESGHNPGRQRQRRLELAKLYANLADDPEADTDLPPATLKAPALKPLPVPAARPPAPAVPGWPFDADEAARRQDAAGPVTRREIDLGDGLKLHLALIPAGQFPMGDPDGPPDEHPLARVAVPAPFWLGTCEVTNEQFARFDPTHDSRVESKNAYQFGVHGYPVNEPAQPVVRVAWTQAVAFCRWLSDQASEPFTLPTEAQWEWACRAGTATALAYGGLDDDFSKHANLADAKLREFASNPYTVFQPLRNATPYDDWMPKDTRFNDGALLSTAVGSYKPNPWGLHDMHGNMAEWTLSAYKPYPYRDDDGRNDASPEGRKAVRGGSWRDRPTRCRSAFRLAYPAHQRVFNVTFRVAAPATPPPAQ